MMNLIDNYKIINSETDTSIILLHSYGKTEKRKKDGNLKDTIKRKMKVLKFLLLILRKK